MSGLEVDLEVMVQAATALDQSSRDLDALGRALVGGSYTIAPGSFTLWDPGAHAEYAKARQEVLDFVAGMRDHFHVLSMDLLAVAQSYGDTDTGNADGIRHSGDGLDNTSGITRALTA